MSAADETRTLIHDLGYRRYLGNRRPQRTRYRVIVKNVIVDAWRGYWKMKIWVLSAVVATVVTGALMKTRESEVFRGIARSGVPLPTVDALMPLSFEWFAYPAVLLSLTVGCIAVAKDLRTGAFEFYFSRPVRPIDYVLGKVGGMFLIMGTCLFAGPMLLALFRIGLAADSVKELSQAATVLPKTFVVALVATAAYSVVPLGFSAISTNTRYTIGAWAGFYLFIGNLLVVIAHTTKTPALAALNLKASVMSVAMGMFEVEYMKGEFTPPLSLAFASIGAYMAISVGFLYWRVTRAQRTGLGGG